MLWVTRIRSSAAASASTSSSGSPSSCRSSSSARTSWPCTRSASPTRRPDTCASRSSRILLVSYLEERVELQELFERTPLIFEDLFDLLREPFGVGARELQMALGHERVALAKSCFVITVGPTQVNDLPDVEAAPDRPGATWRAA